MLLDLIPHPGLGLPSVACPSCGRRCRRLVPPGWPTTTRRVVKVVDFFASAVDGQIELPDRAGVGLPWACMRCRYKGGSIPSSMGRDQRDHFAVEQWQNDPDRTRRRPRESWASVERRRRRAQQALARIEARLQRRLLRSLGGP